MFQFFYLFLIFPGSACSYVSFNHEPSQLGVLGTAEHACSQSLHIELERCAVGGRVSERLHACQKGLGATDVVRTEMIRLAQPDVVNHLVELGLRDGKVERRVSGHVSDRPEPVHRSPIVQVALAVTCDGHPQVVCKQACTHAKTQPKTCRHGNQ